MYDATHTWGEKLFEVEEWLRECVCVCVFKTFPLTVSYVTTDCKLPAVSSSHCDDVTEK